MPRNVLVTGAGGFIGSHLAEALVRRGERVRAYVRYNGRGDAGRLEALPSDVRNEIEIQLGDITDPYAVASAVQGCSVVFHLAALIAIPYSYVAPHSFFTTNTLGTVHLLEAARHHELERIVHVSTSECYGTAQTPRIAESHRLVGQSPYAASKIGADQAAQSFHLAFGLPIVTVRPFNAYGPRQSARAVIPTVITQALNGGVVHLGDLTPRRDLTFVTDTVAGMIAAAETPGVSGETLNLGSGRDISIGDLVERIFALLAADGISARIERDAARVRPPSSEVQRLCADSTKAAERLGWRPSVALSDGLSRTIAAIRDDLASYPRVTTYQR